MLTRAQFAALCEAARHDPERLFAGCFRITTKNLPGQPPIANLVLNKAQRRVHDAVMAMRREGLPPRVITLKCRQAGISTLAAGYLTATLLTQPYSLGIEVAHLDDAAEKLFRKVRFMIDRLPRELRPKIKYEKRRELALDVLSCSDADVKLDSLGLISSAGGKQLWRGLTVHAAHLSELAFCANAESLLTGILQAVTKSPESLVLIESTANGMDNVFATEWARAEAGESAFRPVFVPWTDMPEHAMAVPQDFVLDPEEQELLHAYGLTREQLQWRRWKLFESFAGNRELFAQEFPISAQEAFLVTGRPAFPVERLRQMRERALAEGRVRHGAVDLEGRFHEESDGRCRVFKPPAAGHEYVVGADPSSGIEGGDYAAAAVLDRTTQEVVAVWQGHLTPVEFAHVCLGLGYYYLEAIQITELTGGFGLGVLEEMKMRGYPRFYVWQRHDRIANTVTSSLGWLTSWATRPLLFDGLRYAIHHGDVMIWDPTTITELLSCQYSDRRYIEGKTNDDLSFAVMLAWRCHLEMPLASTGAPPRLQLPDASPPPGPAPDRLTNVEREAWDAVDRDLKGRAGAPLAHPDVFAYPGDEEDDGEWGWEPPGGLW